MEDIAPEKIYSPVVIEHMHNPRNWGILAQSDGYARITGPCGDTMEISLQVRDDMIIECTFDTDGCGATVSCGSIVTEMASGKKVAQAKQIDQESILTYCRGLPQANRHCALLAASTLQKALEDYGRTRNESWRKFYRTT
ncbi:MAG: iron-sulfur cluster assembly scaffold protein [candidate division WOR-3 bacterium]|jgi:nitrogen fixation NifU-like protein